MMVIEQMIGSPADNEIGAPKQVYRKPLGAASFDQNLTISFLYLTFSLVLVILLNELKGKVR